MKVPERNITMHDVESLKKMTSAQRKVYEMSQLKNSFDAASKNGVLRVQNAFTVKRFVDK
ncbi:hypothetical protein H5A21_01900 [Pectobacterium aquaticum]|nr:hypothetical protein [Pectobacterium aquaticum]MBN3062869.1 hypothetical protein [Pectobacterium aquaticum]